MDDVVGIMVTWMESQIQVMQCGNKTCLLFRSGWQEWLFTPGIVLLGSSKIKRTIEMLLRHPQFPCRQLIPPCYSYSSSEKRNEREPQSKRYALNKIQ
jgi:hypothetical protein